jgi:hypothetical protein
MIPVLFPLILTFSLGEKEQQMIAVAKHQPSPAESRWV